MNNPNHDYNNLCEDINKFKAKICRNEYILY